MSARTFQLSTLDRNPYECYVRVILCFQSDKSTTSTSIAEKFRTTLDKLQDAIPWLAGKIYSRTGSLNEVKLVLSPSDKIKFIVNNIEDKMPSYSELAAKRMPQVYMKEELVSHTLLTPDRSSEYSPAFVLQANFITGGLLLTLAGHHCLIDGTSMGILMDVLARLYSGHDLSPEEIQSFHPIEDRHSLFDGPLGSMEPVSLNGLPQQGITDPKTTQPYPATPPIPHDLMIKLFLLTPESLSELKRLCTPPSASTWISTGDALCALIWTSINRARHLHKSAATALLNPNTTQTENDTKPTTESPNNITTGNSTSTSDPIPSSSTLAIPINIRTRSSPPFPTSYLGNAYLDSLRCLPLSTLLSSLQDTAIALRKSIASVDAPYIARTLGMFRAAENKAIVRTLGFDSLITSWVDQPAYTAEFGPELGGKAKWVRTPNRVAFNGVVTILPRSEEGVEVAIQLYDNDMERLLADEWWMKWVGAVSD